MLTDEGKIHSVAIICTFQTFKQEPMDWCMYQHGITAADMYKVSKMKQRQQTMLSFPSTAKG